MHAENERAKTDLIKIFDFLSAHEDKHSYYENNPDCDENRGEGIGRKGDEKRGKKCGDAGDDQQGANGRQQ